jgi:hypothetical protein
VGTTNDLELLQKYEPVVHFTKGELFYPCGVDGYLKRCSLWVRDPRGREKQLAEEGELSAERLAEFKEVPPKHVLFLRFVDEPLDVLEYQSWLRQPDRPSFQTLGRMARVGLFSRIMDSFVDASLLVRGVVPGGTTAAAEVRYQGIRAEDPSSVYYSRVLRDGNYLILHYIFFYVMNDYRSTFDGINDHESDWEQIFVYLTDEEKPQPAWVAYASHDFSGDDLRRRWDDPDLQKVEGTHPVIFAGGGSHSSYFLSGDYLISIEPKFLKMINNAVSALRTFWTETLGQGLYAAEETEARFVMPYIDYARGDGLSIGPEQERGWKPIILSEEMGWAENYRGLWGLDTRDRFGGERGPAGPKFNRDGTVRVSWYDPLGWAGLDKVPPTTQAPSQLKDDISALEKEIEALGSEITEKRNDLRHLEMEVQSLKRTDYLDKLHKSYQKQLEEAQKNLRSMTSKHTDLAELLAASRSYQHAMQSGDYGDPHSHIQVLRYPEPPLSPLGKFSAYWAAISGGLLLFAFAVLFLFRPSSLIFWMFTVVTLFLAVESAIWKRLTKFLLSITVTLAIFTGLILIKDFLWEIIMLGLMGIVILSLARNLRELKGK